MQVESEAEPQEPVGEPTEEEPTETETVETETVEMTEPVATADAESTPDTTEPMVADFDATDEEALAAIGVPGASAQPDRESREGPPDTGPIAALAALAAGGAPKKPTPPAEPQRDTEDGDEAAPLEAAPMESEPSLATVEEPAAAVEEPAADMSEDAEAPVEPLSEAPQPAGMSAPSGTGTRDEDLDTFQADQADYEPEDAEATEATEATEAIESAEANASAEMASAGDEGADTLFLAGDMPAIPGEAGEEPVQPAASSITEVDAESAPADEAAASAVAAEDAETAPRFGQSTAHIAAHISANHQRVSLIAAADDSREDRTIALNIAVALIDQGLSVALVDAGGVGEEGDGPGLTDLAAGLADFGDVVQRVEEPGLYYVSWGRQEELSKDSERIGMLIEALGELHDHILITCGAMGDSSSLEMFAEAGMPLVLASKAETTIEQITRMSNQARAAGFGPVSLARPGEAKAEVA